MRLVGKRVAKFFDGRKYFGEVRAFRPASEGEAADWLIAYDDGDNEHLEHDALQEAIALARPADEAGTTRRQRCGLRRRTTEPTVGDRLRSHEESLLRQRDLRRRADEERERHVRRQRARARSPEMIQMIKEFRIDGGIWADPERPLASDVWLEGAWELLTEWRAQSTWRRYGPAWRRVKKWLRGMCAASRLPFTIKTFRENPQILSAMAMWALRSSSAQTAVETVVLAARMAFRVNGWEVPDDLITRIAREAARRSRGKMVRKKAGFTVDMVRAIAARWGAKGQPLAKRMVSVAIMVGFLGLLRFSDLRVICISGILWMPEGVVIVLPSRKNAQHRPSLIYLADTGAVGGVVVRLRHLVRDLTGVPTPIEGYMRSPRFLFRTLTRVGGYTHGHKVQHRVGAGVDMIHDRGYGAYLSAFRRAARECCGFSKAACKELGTQSLRSGGDTFLHAQGLTAEERRDVGQWATPLVERGYLRRTLREKLAFMRAAGL